MPRVKAVKKRPAKKAAKKSRAAGKGKAAVAETAVEAPGAEDLAAEESTAAQDAKTPADKDEPDLDSLKQMFDEAAKLEEDGFGLRYADVECPYCGEDFEIAVDPGEEGQEMIQDCRACCKPINLYIEVVDGEISVDAFGS